MKIHVSPPNAVVASTRHAIVCLHRHRVSTSLPCPLNSIERRFITQVDKLLFHQKCVCDNLHSYSTSIPHHMQGHVHLAPPPTATADTVQQTYTTSDHQVTSLTHRSSLTHYSNQQGAHIPHTQSAHIPHTHPRLPPARSTGSKIGTPSPLSKT